PGDRAGRVDERAAGAQRDRAGGQDRALQAREARDRRRVLAPARVGAPGEGAEVGTGRVHEHAIVTRTDVVAGGVGAQDRHVAYVGTLAKFLDLAGAAGVDLNRHNLALARHPRRDPGRLEARTRAEIQ